MASAECFDLYTCEICLENMLDKNPRLLSCHHGFCTNCLQRLMKNGTVQCPTCRDATTVPNNDTNLLKANFMLLKVKDHMEKVHSSKTLLCQLCLAENAVLKCQECVQLLCENCKMKHNKLKTFLEHKIYKLCMKHKEGMITHLCVKCAQVACSKCVITEHSDHEESVKSYDVGLKQIKQNLNKFKSDINGAIQTVTKYMDQDKQELKNITKSIEKVEQIREDLQQQLKKAEQAAQKLQLSKEEGQKKTANYQLKINDWNKAKATLQGKLVEISDGNLESYTGLKQEIESILAEQNNLTRFHPAEIDIQDPKTGKMIRLARLTKPEVHRPKVYSSAAKVDSSTTAPRPKTAYGFGRTGRTGMTGSGTAPDGTRGCLNLDNVEFIN